MTFSQRSNSVSSIQLSLAKREVAMLLCYKLTDPTSDCLSTSTDEKTIETLQDARHIITVGFKLVR